MPRRSFRRASRGSPAPRRRDSGATRSAPSAPLPWPSATAPADFHSRRASPRESSARVRLLQWVFRECRQAARAGSPVSALQSFWPWLLIFSVPLLLRSLSELCVPRSVASVLFLFFLLRHYQLFSHLR